jgi:choline dehydrogenase-like flavoprotein
VIHDFIIVGSGVSGGRLALELTRMGASCLLLEAGSEYGKTSFPSNERDGAVRLFWGGGMELTSDGRLLLLRGKVLGGGSVVNQALMDRFDDLAWRDWRDRTRIRFFNESDMTPHYEAVERSVASTSIAPPDASENARVFARGMSLNGLSWSGVKRAQTDCAGSDCIACLNGCRLESKQSTLITAIRDARRLGLKVHTGFTVDHLVDVSTAVWVRGWSQGQQVTHTARRVVLAAALGNTPILLKSGFQKSLPALGHGFSCHPQFMSFGYFREPVDPHKGAFQGAKSADAKLRRDGIKLESVCCPPIATALIMPGDGQEHLRAMTSYRHYASVEVAIRDEPSGVVKINNRGSAVVCKQLSHLDLARRDAGIRVMNQVLTAAGAERVLTSVQPFALHLMGGCSIGTDPATSVVDPEFRVHGHRNITIADSSIFPSAPGINPWLSIAALTHRAAGELARC